MTEASTNPGDRGLQEVRGGPALGRLAFPLLGIGIAALATVAWLSRAEPRQLLGSYLVAYAFFWTLALGGLFFVLVHHTMRAGWGVVVRRLAEQMAWPLVLLALLFVPIALGAGQLYPWLGEEAAGDPLLVKKAAYLNQLRFGLTAVVCFGIWITLAQFLRRRSLEQDRGGRVELSQRLRRVSAPALVLFAVTLTIASFDWLMSLQPHWYSTIFGVYVFAGSGCAIVAFLVLAAVALGRRPALGVALKVDHFHDLGKLLFAFACFWAYIAFSQFLLIWYASLPEETHFFGARLLPGWKPVTVGLALGHFGFPFLWLMSRHIKRRPMLLGIGALWLLGMHYLDLYWIVVPTLRPDSAVLRLSDLLAFVGIGASFLAVYLLALGRAPLLPVGDPRLSESLTFTGE